MTNPYRDPESVPDEIILFRNWVEKGAWLFHHPTGLIAKAVRFYDAVTEHYCSAAFGALPVLDPVIMLEGGHTLVARRIHFAELDRRELEFFAAIQQGLSALVMISAKNAASSGVELGVGLALTISALRMQLASLEAKGEDGE